MLILRTSVIIVNVIYCRRRVSSLLHSDFRESLDQLIQSYVERQTNVPEDWELHEMSLPPFTTQNQDQLSTGHSEESEPIHVEETQRTLPRPPPLPQAHWGHHANWSRHESRQRPGTVSFIIALSIVANTLQLTP